MTYDLMTLIYKNVLHTVKVKNKIMPNIYVKKYFVPNLHVLDRVQ